MVLKLRQKICLVCETKNPEKNKHCVNCGQPLVFSKDELFHRPSNVKPILIGIVIGWISLLLVIQIAGQL